MERWDLIGEGRYRNAHGEVLDRDELMEKLARQSLKDDFLVQPRLANHPALDDISNGALATVRLLTCRNEQGMPEATNAAFRMAIGNSVVDNFHQGGLATEVDLETGVIGIASDIGIRPDVGWRDTHPSAAPASPAAPCRIGRRWWRLPSRRMRPSRSASWWAGTWPCWRTAP